MREVKLPSGATLKVNASPFAIAKDLQQALLRELKAINLSMQAEGSDLLKEFFCAGFSSLQVEQCLWACMTRCLYDDGSGKGALKIDGDTFEPVERRQDYFKVCVEVARENVDPFLKGLFAEYRIGLAMYESFQPSPPPMTT